MICRKISWLVHKYKSDKCSYLAREQFERVLWYSIPVIFKGWENYIKYDKKVKALYKSAYRWRKHFRKMMLFGVENIYFCTFTFSSELAKKEAKQQYMSRYLNKICKDYICSLEFGDKNGRLHYHALCVFEDSVVLTPSKFANKKVYVPNVIWKHGIFTIEKPKMLDKSWKYVEKSFRYVTKTKKPFHKRNVEYPLAWSELGNDDELPICER